ncbi:MAG TPA: serine/threonine-protein kinase, partial [Fimbriimonadaceae bacterium]|nr:serine/threonine-protein kinase [Fimbriimonadaceae bacterium]
MPNTPPALPEGTVLAERFQLEAVLGRGGFSIAYRAQDLLRKDHCVVKELAPANSRREPDGMLDLGDSPTANHLRQRFLEEARTLNAARLRGVLPTRHAFVELGTAYFATDYLPGSETLADVLRREGRLDPHATLDVLMQLLEILEAVHAKGIVHRDIKPTNVLIDPRGEVHLIDFGAAREWHADAAEAHTVIFTPGYAAPEQYSERTRRGPATDLYGLCATAFHMLTGGPPPTAAERAGGLELPPLVRLVPGIEPAVARALELGLELRFCDRPQTAGELRALLADVPAASIDRPLLEVFDERRTRLKGFSYEKKACPACGGLMERPRPLKRGVCPVCHEGIVAAREIDERLCPQCRVGVLRAHGGPGQLVCCPGCRTGLLERRRRGVLKSGLVLSCPQCSASYEQHDGEVRDVDSGETRTPQEWRQVSGRSERVWVCDSCSAQFDELPDGRRMQMTPQPERAWSALYPDEWARVAAGYDPGAGNAECGTCRAEYFVEGDSATLLEANRDPFDFARHHLGRRHTWERLQWLAVGKESPAPGMVCIECGTEFDTDGGFLRFVSSPDGRLAAASREPRTLEDWHRIAQDLPTVDREAAFEEEFDRLVTEGYRGRELPFETRDPTLHWRSPAKRLERIGDAFEEAAAGTLTISDAEVIFGGLLRKWRVPLDALLVVSGRGDLLE